MFFALIFVCNRISQLITLTPVVGMLGWFVSTFNAHNAFTPDPVLVLFLVSLLAITWALLTLISYHTSSHNAMLVALLDLLFAGSFVGGVYTLRGIPHAECDHPSPRTYWTSHVPGMNDAGIAWGLRKECAMLKASWAFSIINIMLFVVTAFAAWLHGDKAPERRGHARVLADAYEESAVRSRRSGRSLVRGRSSRSPQSRRSHSAYA